MNEISGRERDELVALVRRIIDADFDSESLLDVRSSTQLALTSSWLSSALWRGGCRSISSFRLDRTGVAIMWATKCTNREGNPALSRKQQFDSTCNVIRDVIGDCMRLRRENCE